MLDVAARRILFSKTERFFLKNQAYPFVLTKKSQHSDDTSDYEVPEDYESQTSLYLQKIISGVKVKYKDNKPDHSTDSNEAPFEQQPGMIQFDQQPGMI